MNGQAVMLSASNERVVYLNSAIVQESHATVPIRDRGLRSGDACCDMARTFNRRPFKLRDHAERLHRSLHYLCIAIFETPDEMIRTSEELLACNLHLLGPDEDYWVTQRVSRGVDGAGDEPPIQAHPTVLVECMPLPHRVRAHLYGQGIDPLIPSLRRIPPSSLNPRAKGAYYLNHALAHLEVKARSAHAWALLLDHNGNLCEGTSNNVFGVPDGPLLTPREQVVLPGISRQTVFELAQSLGIPCEERDIDVYDVANADEMLLTITGMCIVPMCSIEARRFASSIITAPLTRRLQSARTKQVACDPIAQFRRRGTSRARAPKPWRKVGS